MCVPTLLISGFLQAMAKCINNCDVRSGGALMEEADHRHRRLLRARGEWPGGRCTAEKCNELAASDESCHLTLQPEGLQPRRYHSRTGVPLGEIRPLQPQLGTGRPSPPGTALWAALSPAPKALLEFSSRRHLPSTPDAVRAA